MYVIRPIRTDDIEDLFHCAMTAGVGLTHLPKDLQLLEWKIRDSLFAFSKDVLKPEHEDYFFVLADSVSQKVCGTCAIYSKIGVKFPFDVFEIDEKDHVLRLKQYRNGPSEIGALYLLPESRGGGLGRLLSLSRFLFIATHMNRFENEVIANMRGFIENDQSPLWNAIGYPLLKVEFKEIMSQRVLNESCIENIFAKAPIKISDLPQDAQKTIGKIHPNTQPAFNMLIHEGFKVTNEVDPFDGGPIVKTNTKDLRTVRCSYTVKLKAVLDQPFKGENAIICNGRMDFRACYGVIVCSPDGLATISLDVAKALEVNPGDNLRYIALSSHR
jgi:arginine N-succinyltransferase